MNRNDDSLGFINRISIKDQYRAFRLKNALVHDEYMASIDNIDIGDVCDMNALPHTFTELGRYKFEAILNMIQSVFCWTEAAICNYHLESKRSYKVDLWILEDSWSKKCGGAVLMENYTEEYYTSSVEDVVSKFLSRCHLEEYYYS